MAKKEKTEKETEKQDYDLTTAIQELPTSEPLKKGFEYYLNHNTITIKDNTTLNKEFKKFIKGV